MGVNRSRQRYHVAANALRLRLSRSWSLPQAAVHAGITATQMKDVERGLDSAPPAVVQALAQCYAVTVKELETSPAVLARAVARRLSGDLSPASGREPSLVGRLADARAQAARLGFPALAIRAANLETQALYTQGETGAAIHLALSTLLETERPSGPDRMDLLWTLGRAWLASDRAVMAIPVFSALVRTLPRDHSDRLRALINLGTCYRVAGWYDEARDTYRAALEPAQASGADRRLHAWAALGLAGCHILLAEAAEAERLNATLLAEARVNGWADIETAALVNQAALELHGQGPDRYRPALGAYWAALPDPLGRAQLSETWAILEARHASWAQVVEASERGLGALEHCGSRPHRLVQARLLWWRAVGRTRLGLDGAADDHRWSRDLLAAEGAPADFAARYLEPLLPDASASSAN